MQPMLRPRRQVLVPLSNIANFKLTIRQFVNQMPAFR
jgi:hypothetical protein